MLSFFPTPYPDELWWSVLARFHARSGNIGSSTTTRELFGNHAVLPSVFFANQGFGGLFDRLPRGLIGKEDVFQHHTLIPYALRFASKTRRVAAQEYVINGTHGTAGGNMFSLGCSEFMRYCPRCNQEDAARYGEIYWHRTCQVALVDVCLVHGCNLEDSTVRVERSLGRQYILPTMQNCQTVEPKYDSNEHKTGMAEMVSAFITDDLSIESGFWCSILLQSLKNSGFVFAEVEAHLVYERLCEFYGDELIQHYFRQDRMQQILYRMLKGQWASPEQYALLALCLGIKPSWLTAPGHYLQDIMEEKLREMAGRGYLWKKQRVAEELGVTTWALDGIVKRLGIKPFWKTGQRSQGDFVTIRTSISTEERALLLDKVDRLGIADLSEFLRHIIHNEIFIE